MACIILITLGVGSEVKAQQRQAPLDAVAQVNIQGGEFRSLYSSQASPLVWVKAFKIDKTPVTNQAFYNFLQAQPQWQPQHIKPMFAEANYLQHWQKTTKDGQVSYQPPPKQRQSPVTNVSWFAAQAYCKAQGKHLPSTAEWEFVAKASEHLADGRHDPAYTDTILRWYESRASNDLPAVGQQPANYYGVQDLHGLIWEWTQDFASAKQRALDKSNLQTINKDGIDSRVNLGAFCGAAASGVADPSDYAAFMRDSLRNSLKANYVLPSLGFRCATSR
ncbi:formylglycine-generating enzyme family protein [Brackiella oedipodis]|uniref:formylglycine-generating enzyme family protein n=1 Tax=Brackiella oedipodis TaxID=124225 RepID=UPI0012EB6CE3|nr:formylglycine-generating enzyme family protein [Brackiella oedipodis]